MAESENSIPPEPAGLRPRLTELREAMLLLHKALLESEKVSYEATFGKIASPYHFLKLLTEDPWFAWLSPVTKLIAAMDERLDAKEPLTVDAVDALVARARTLLVASEGGDGFARYNARRMWSSRRRRWQSCCACKQERNDFQSSVCR